MKFLTVFVLMALSFFVGITLAGGEYPQVAIWLLGFPTMVVVIYWSTYPLRHRAGPRRTHEPHHRTPLVEDTEPPEEPFDQYAARKWAGE